MIDIIIPAYNAHNTIGKTLSSISLQDNSFLFNVYIVNDASENDYSEFIEFYKDFIKIKELKLEKNMGPGVARQYGIDNSNSKYIIFIDADDVFYNCFSVKDLFDSINEDKFDLVESIALEETENTFIRQVHHNGNLHGKIYSREFLEKNKIRFNTTYTSEDNGFNQLILLLNPKLKCINKVTYIYRNNEKSLTRFYKKKIDILNDYLYNIFWAIEESKKIKEDKQRIASLLLSTYLFIYYNEYEILDYELKQMKKLEKLYTEYEIYLSEDDKNMIINSKINNNFNKNFLLNNISFEEFRKIMRKE